MRARGTLALTESEQHLLEEVRAAGDGLFYAGAYAGKFGLTPQWVSEMLLCLMEKYAIRRAGRCRYEIIPPPKAKPAVLASGITAPSKFQLMSGAPARRRKRLYEDARA